MEVVCPSDLRPYYTDLSHLRVSGRDVRSSEHLTTTNAWVGANAHVARREETLSLTHTVWHLPDELHGEEVKSLEIRAVSDEVTPLVFAITVE